VRESKLDGRDRIDNLHTMNVLELFKMDRVVAVRPEPGSFCVQDGDIVVDRFAAVSLPANWDCKISEMLLEHHGSTSPRGARG